MRVFGRVVVRGRNDELFDFAALLFDFGGLLLLNPLVLGKGFTRFVALAGAVVCNAEPIPGVGELRPGIDSLCVQRNRGRVFAGPGLQIA